MSTDEKIIPEDLWPDVLKSLPVKKLVQLQSICKSWKALISSSAFVKIHQPTAIASRLEFFSAGLSFSCRIRRGGGGEGPDTDSFFPQIPSYNPITRYPGIVHGIVVLLYYTASRIKSPLVALCNPVIRKHFVIPSLPSLRNTFPELFGVGFDPRTNDFKVVRSHLEGHYDMLSVRDGAWRMDRPSTLLGSSLAPLGCTQWAGCFLNGTIYWIITQATYYEAEALFGRLLLFDCAREEFTTVDLPPRLVSNQIVPHMLLILGSQLVLIEKLPVPGDDIRQLWTMQEDEKGGSATWTRLTSNAEDDDIYCGHFVLTPLAESNHDYARFRRHRPLHGSYYDFQETMMLADIGSPSM